MDREELVRIVIDSSFRIHKRLGPGLFETVYERLLAESLAQQGISAERQKPVSFELDGIRFSEGFRLDLLVEGVLIVEIKSIDRLNEAHLRQVLTYLRLLEQPLGLLINFGGATLKEGIRRVVNNYIP